MRIMAMISVALLLMVGLAFADDDITSRMAGEHATDSPQASPIAEATPARPVTGEDVAYTTVDGTPARGYLARPVGAPAILPALIVVHEWWGLNDNIRAVTRRLAGEGYLALAVDLYGGRTATSPDAARALMQAVMENPQSARDNLRGAFRFLMSTESASRVGVIGWCFGGGWALQTALMVGDGIDATVMYYGQVETDPATLKSLHGPLLGLFGADDTAIPPERVHEFEQALDAAGVDAEIIIYPGAGHAFANPSGTRYEPKAAADAWRRTVAFLATNLKEHGVAAPAGETPPGAAKKD